MVATRNHKYANSSLNYFVIMMLENLKKNLKSEFPIFSHSRDTKCRVEANNNREAVVFLRETCREAT